MGFWRTNRSYTALMIPNRRPDVRISLFALGSKVSMVPLSADYACMTDEANMRDARYAGSAT